jgi:hypothetical protein
MTITFNVLYVPGTVAGLLPFARSLARWSEGCRFRLVANGCPEEERQLLREVCAGEPRFDFHALPGARVVPHGAALAALQRAESSEVFAFVDSDIFATGPWLPELRQELRRRDAVFSCPPVWSEPELATMPLSFKVLGGCYQHLEDGRCLGNSYFGVYDNRRLQETIRRHGVSFERVSWREVPRHLQERLRERGLEKTILDTGRLLNLLLGIDGRELAFLPLPGLGHIGGVSGVGMAERRRTVARLRLRTAEALTALRQRLLRDEDPVSAPERDLIRRKARRRRATVRHFSALLRALAEERPFAEPFPLEEPRLVAEILALEGRIRALYAEGLAGLATSPPRS